MGRNNSDEVLRFLEDWKTSKEIREEFDFTTSEWFNFSSWLRPHFIRKIEGVNLDDKTNRTYIYKKKEGVDV